MKLIYIQGMRSFSETFIRSEKAYMSRRHEVISMDLARYMSANPFLLIYYSIRRLFRKKSLLLDRYTTRLLYREFKQRRTMRWKLIGIWVNLDLLASHLERAKGDRMVLHFLFDNTLLGYLLCRHLHIPYYLRLHTRTQRISPAGVVEIISHAHKVYAISEHLRRHFQQLVTTDIYILPQRVLPVPKQFYKLESGPVRMVSACRWIPKKGLVQMIYAMALLPEELRWQWVIYGEGPEEERMREAVLAAGLENRILLNPKVSHRVLLEQLGKAHILLAPSVQTSEDEDGIPTVIPEAMLRRTLVLSTAVGGIPELILDGQTGYVLNVDDRSILSQQLEAILRKRGEWDNIIEHAEALARQRYVDEWEFEL